MKIKIGHPASWGRRVGGTFKNRLIEETQYIKEDE